MAQLAAAGASVLGGLLGGLGAKSAAKKQAKAIKQGIFEQQRQFGITQANMSPWIFGGQGALQQILDLLGIGGSSGMASGATAQDLVNYLVSVGKGKSGKLMNKWLAANQNLSPEQQLAGLKQFAGSNELESLNQYALAHPYHAAGTAESASDAQARSIGTLKASPLYTSQYDTGVDTVLQNASATGGLRGGNTTNSLAQFGSTLLAQVIQNQLANLSGVSGLGENAAGGLGNIGQSNANAQSNLYGQLGQANGLAAAAPYAALQSIIKGVGSSAGNFFGGGGGGISSGNVGSLIGNGDIGRLIGSNGSIF
jgi:hypothetical protein